MLLTASTALESLLSRWHAVVQRWALWIVFLILLLAEASVYYVVENLSINTDTVDMLSEKLPWRSTYTRYKEAFPQYSDTIAVVIDGETPDQVQDTSLLLVKRLRQETKLFQDVYQPENSPFFRKNQLLYLSIEELEDLADNLAKVQPFLGKLASDQSLHGLFTVLSEAMTEMTKGEEYEIGPAFEHISETLQAHAQNRRHPLSWQELMSGRDLTTEDRRTVIIVKPRLNFSKLLPGEPAVQAIRKIARDLGLTPENGVRVRLTGGAALSYDEMTTVTDGALTGTLLALIMVLGILVIGFGSLWLVLATLIKLIIGLIFTAAFATFAVGELNFISIGFAMLYIGLGVEYAVHYCLCYKELSVSHDPQEALRKTGRHIGTALIFSALTSAIGFYAFIPTAYSGIAELGLIMGTGMFISSVLSLTLLPALLSLIPIKRAPQHRGIPALMRLFSLPSRYPKTVITVAGSLAVAALLIMPKATFDRNPLHLQDPTAESVRTYHDLLRESSRSPLSIIIVAKNVAAARALSNQLERLETVDEAVTLDDFVPADQDEKLVIIEEMALVVGPELDLRGPGDKPSLKEQKLALIQLLTALKRYLASNPVGPLANSAAQLYRDFKVIEARLEMSDESTQVQMINQLENNLISLLPGRLRSLGEVLHAEAFTLEDLPSELVKRWRVADGRYRVEVFPRENLNDNHALLRFVSQVRVLAPDQATGEPVIDVEASATVIRAFQQAFIYALVAITLLLLLLMKHNIDVPLGLTPLLLAGLFTGAATVVLDIPFNFANIITLPLILGICVDNSIHILHRYRAGGLPAVGPLFNTSAVRGVILSALTNIAGLGNLALSPHQGTASMGIMLVIGISFSLLTSLIVLPSLLKLLPLPQTLRRVAI